MHICTHSIACWKYIPSGLGNYRPLTKLRDIKYDHRNMWSLFWSKQPWAHNYYQAAQNGEWSNLSQAAGMTEHDQWKILTNRASTDKSGIIKTQMTCLVKPTLFIPKVLLIKVEVNQFYIAAPVLTNLFLMQYIVSCHQQIFFSLRKCRH